MEYQRGFSSLHESMYDVDGRRRKARTALRVLRNVLGDQLAASRLLNVGSSSGIMDAEFAGEFLDVVGIDIDRPPSSMRGGTSSCQTSTLNWATD